MIHKNLCAGNCFACMLDRILTALIFCQCKCWARLRAKSPSPLASSAWLDPELTLPFRPSLPDLFFSFFLTRSVISSGLSFNRLEHLNMIIQTFAPYSADWFSVVIIVRDTVRVARKIEISTRPITIQTIVISLETTSTGTFSPYL